MLPSIHDFFIGVLYLIVIITIILESMSFCCGLLTKSASKIFDLKPNRVCKRNHPRLTNYKVLCSLKSAILILVLVQ